MFARGVAFSAATALERAEEAIFPLPSFQRVSNVMKRYKKARLGCDLEASALILEQHGGEAAGPIAPSVM
jgi:hypothetical protein